MAMFNVNTHRLDPYKNFKFRVKMDGRYVAGISKISALNRLTEVVSHRDGGDLSHSRLSPGLTAYEPITLERGVSHDMVFQDWADQVFSLSGDSAVSLKEYKKDLLIELFNLQGQLVMAFMVYRCWVSEYRPFSELDANHSSVAIERIVLQHEGWERDRSISEPAES